MGITKEMRRQIQQLQKTVTAQQALLEVQQWQKFIINDIKVGFLDFEGKCNQMSLLIGLRPLTHIPVQGDT